MFIFSEFNPISKAEISELIETKNKMMKAEIELIKAKCLSEAEIIELIKSNIGSGKSLDCPVDNPIFRIVDGTCLR